MALRKRSCQKLVDALRSGEYTKTKGRLRDGRSFDVLGVACDVYKKSTRKGVWRKVSVSDKEQGFAVSEDRLCLSEIPPEVVTWYGFDSTSPSIIHKGGMVMMIDLNDYHNFSFTKIADILEKNL